MIHRLQLQTQWLIRLITPDFHSPSWLRLQRHTKHWQHVDYKLSDLPFHPVTRKFDIYHVNESLPETRSSEYTHTIMSYTVFLSPTIQVQFLMLYAFNTSEFGLYKHGVLNLTC